MNKQTITLAVAGAIIGAVVVGSASPSSAVPVSSSMTAFKQATRSALLNTRYEVSDGRPVPIAAPRWSDTTPVKSLGNFAQGIRSGLPDRIEHGDQVCRKFVRCLHLCNAS